MKKAWVLVLVLSLLGCEVLACWLDQSGRPFAGFEAAYRSFHLLQMFFLIVLAELAFAQLPSGSLWRSVSRLVFIGLCFSFVGDLINSFLFDLSFILDPQTLLSAIPFAIAHCLYIAAFWRLGRNGPQAVTGGFVLTTLLIWPLLAIGLWWLIVDSSAGPVLKWLSYAYAHMVVLMALASFWPLKAWGRAAWVAVAGGLIFLLSDAFFGAWLAEGQSRPLWVSQTIWATYFLAQLAIAHVPLIGRSAERLASST